MKGRKLGSKICKCLAGLLVLLFAFIITDMVKAVPSVSQINGGPIKLIYDYIGHYELNYTGNTNNYDYWDASGTSKLVTRTYRDRTDIAQNNSSATISKTDSNSKIVKAYLIWETRSENGVSDSVLLVTPNNSGKYITADVACKDTRTNASGQKYTAVYTMAAEVTDLVTSTNGGYGTYTVANIPVWEGASGGVACGGESVASWQLVVVEESPNFPLRTISLNLMSQYFFNEDYSIGVHFADASSPSGVVTASFLTGFVNVDTSYTFDGIGYPDDFNYEQNGHYFRYKTLTRGLYKNGVSINDRDTGGEYGKEYAVGATRVHLFDDKRRTNSVESESLTYYGKGKNIGNNIFLYGVAIDIFQYDIKFDGNGADSGSMADLKGCVYGRWYGLPKNAFKKVNYRFNGWNTKADGSGITHGDMSQVLNLTKSKSTVTLYAQWIPETYEIMLNHQYATSYGTVSYFEWYGKGNYSTKECHTEISKITSPTKVGHRFGGYWTKEGGPDGGGICWIDLNGKILSDKTTFTKDTTLYAYWIPEVYKITLDNQGATTAGTKEYYEKYDVGNYTTEECTTVITKITKPKKDYHTFKGYFTEKNGNGQEIIDKDGNVPEAYTIFTEDTTLYAYWEPVTYTITLNPQSATTRGDAKVYEKYGESFYRNETTVTTSKGEKTKTFEYTGGSQTFVAPFDGTYKLTAYGAGGYGSTASDGIPGKTYGTISLKKGDVLWIYVGGKGSSTAGGYNGGGAGGTVFTGSDDNRGTVKATASGGGGATDFRKGGSAKSNRIMVAGGSGGNINISFSVGTQVTIHGGSSFGGVGNTGIHGFPVTGANMTLLYNAGSLLDGTEPVKNKAAVNNQGDVLTSGNNNTFELTLFHKGSLGNGATGAGGGYYGGSHLHATYTAPVLSGIYIYGSGAGSSYVGGVKNGILYKSRWWTEDNSGLCYYDDTTGEEELITKGNQNGKASITYEDFNTKTTQMTTKSVVVPSRKGYKFDGYWTEKNGGGERLISASGNITVEPDYFTEDTTLYANWIEEDNKYWIYYNANGGEGTMTRSICGVDADVTLKANTFTRKGYKFAGWNTKADGSGKSYKNKAVVKNLAKEGEGITLYARWTAEDVSYKVNHYTETLTGEWDLYSSEDKRDVIGTVITTSFLKKEISGFTYGYSIVDGNEVTTAKVYNDGTLVVNLYYKMTTDGVSVFRIELDNQGADEEGTREYYEKYGVGNYTSAECATEISTIVIPKRTGYTFGGYFTEKNGRGLPCIETDGIITSTPTTFAKNEILYAYWIPIGDDSPWIEADDQYYSLKDAQSGLITYDELMSHAAAFDKEDGDNIPAGTNPDTGTTFAIIDYAPTDFTFFTSDGSVTETFMVVDSAGNTYKQRITVYIVDTEPKVIKPKGTTRFINEKYYHLPYEEGGLEDNSIWKTNPEYVSIIEDAFRRSREDDPLMTFYYEYETILEMKKNPSLL